MGEVDKLYSDPDDPQLGEGLLPPGELLSSPEAVSAVVAEECRDDACKKRQQVAEDLDLSKLSVEEFFRLDPIARLKLISDFKGGELTEGTRITFSFKGNKALESVVGFGDLPVSVRALKFGSNIYERRKGQGFYSPRRGYLFLTDGVSAEVARVDKSFDNDKLSSDYVVSFKPFEGDEDILNVAIEFGVDAHLLQRALQIAQDLKIIDDTNRTAFLRNRARLIENLVVVAKPKILPSGLYQNDFATSFLRRAFPTASLSKINNSVVGYGTQLPASSDFDGDFNVPLESPLETPTPIIKPAKEKLSRASSRSMRYPVDVSRVSGYLKEMKVDEPLILVDGAKYVKETVAKMFRDAQSIAATHGYRIGVTSGYRDPGTQAKLHQHAEDEGHNEGNKWVAGAGLSWHNAGCAMDIALFDSNGKQLTPLTGREMASSKKFPLHYRKLLEQIMNQSGFVRYDVEDWHFEVGSQGWFEIMKERGVLPQDSDSKAFVYLRDKPRRRSYHTKIARQLDPGFEPELVPSPDEPHESHEGHDAGVVEYHESMPDINDKWRKRREAFENIIKSGFEGKAIVENFSGNSGRPVGILIPKGTDVSKPVEMVYQFHGDNCEKFGQDVRADQALQLVMNEASQVGRNVVVVYPLGPDYNKNNSPKQQWMGAGSKDNMSQLHSQVLDQVFDRPVQVSKIIVKGHSAGGEAIMNTAKAGFVADRYDFMDASYAGWASTTYNLAMKNAEPLKKKLEFNVFALAGTGTDKGARVLAGKPGVNVEWENPKHVSHPEMVSHYFNYKRPGEERSLT